MNDLRDGLGPELADFEIEDLNPQRLAHKHLFGGLTADRAARPRPAANGTPRTPGGHPPPGPGVTDPQGANQARQGDRPPGPRRGDHKGGMSSVRKKDL